MLYSKMCIGGAETFDWRVPRRTRLGRRRSAFSRLGFCSRQARESTSSITHIALWRCQMLGHQSVICDCFSQSGTRICERTTRFPYRALFRGLATAMHLPKMSSFHRHLIVGQYPGSLSVEPVGSIQHTDSVLVHISELVLLCGARERGEDGADVCLYAIAHLYQTCRVRAAYLNVQ